MIRNVSRVLVGLVFIFSGFVKGVDPLGTAYRIEDYFVAYGWDWAMPFSLFLSISLCTLEFVLGVALLFNLRIRVLAWPLAIMMVFFTGLTYYDALYEPVPDCGCFGDAIKLTNWQTFYKNIFLVILVLLIFMHRKNYRSIFSKTGQNLILIAVTVGFVAFTIYQYNHLPMIDFREWKVGTDLVPEDAGVPKVYVTYRNTETGEEKEFLSPDYPWDDSAWMSKWEFAGQRIDDSMVKKGHSLVLYDLNGNIVTDEYINNPDHNFLLVSWNLEEADQEALREAGKLYEEADQRGYSFIVITGSLSSEIDKYRDILPPGIEFFNADDIELKTMIRSNPGLILLKDGVVIDKWHYNDFPDDLEHIVE